MKLGEDYVLCVDPRAETQDDWSVILNNDPWEDIVLRFNDIRILEKGTKLQFSPEILFNPYDADTESVEFEDYVASVLDDIIRNMHAGGAMQYFSVETGERIDV